MDLPDPFGPRKPVTLPGWTYPVVIDTASGDVRYDNFGGAWGSQHQLDRLMQAYAEGFDIMQGSGAIVLEAGQADWAVMNGVLSALGATNTPSVFAPTAWDRP